MILLAVGASVLLAVSTLVFVATRYPRWTTRLAGSLADEWLNRYRDHREQVLESAHVGIGYRQYAAFTLAYAAAAAISGAVFSGAFVAFVLSEFAFPADVRWLTTVLVMGWLGLVSGVALYWLRWWWPRHTAAARGRRIDATMPRTVAFLYALSRSGMPVPEVLRAFADNEAVYGEAAGEVSLTVREMDLVGADLVSALEATARRTPSTEFEKFLANVTSVLRSGQALPEFLETQYERYQDHAEAKQERLLTQYATLAEVYVTALVAGPLFLLTILVVIGLTLDDTLPALGALVYLVLPLANLVFIVYLSTLSEPMRPGEVGPADTTEFGGAVNVRRRKRALPDGGEYERSRCRARNEACLASYERMRGLRERISDPIGSVRERPERLLYLTVPLAILVAFARLWNPLTTGTLDVHAVDDVLVQSGLFVLLTYAGVAVGRERRVARIERALPDVLSRLASINEAGVSVTDSVGRLRRGDLGVLSVEFDRIWRDIEWGADIESALWRFERRVQAASITRMVALVTNAAGASGRLAPVLRIAAEQGGAERRLERDRKQELLTYSIVIYVSFLVFVLIIAVLNSVLIPSLPDTTGDLQAAGANFGGVDTDAYTIVFGHALLIQGALSGYIAGRMSTDSVRGGAIHAAVLSLIAYVVVLVLLI